MDVKSFLHSWCAKKSLNPTFDVRPTGPKHRQRFLCEVRVNGISYVGAGNSTTKKDAQMNASKDFVNFLVRTNQVSQNEVPEEVKVKVEPISDFGNSNNGNFQNSGSYNAHEQQRPVFQEGMGPESMGQAYQAYGGPSQNFTYMDRLQQQKNVEEAEDLDVNASLHGNWNMENAKSKLHQFMQMNKISTDYAYKAVGPDHTRVFYAHFGLVIGISILFVTAFGFKSSTSCDVEKKTMWHLSSLGISRRFINVHSK